MTTADPSPEFVDRPWMGEQREPESVVIADRGWLATSHAAPALLWILFPYGSALIVPLLIWQVKAEKEGNRPLILHSVEALNFQINLTLVCIALSISVIGLLVVPIVLIAGLVLSLIAGYKAYHGVDYRYPWIKRVIKVEQEQPVV